MENALGHPSLIIGTMRLGAWGKGFSTSECDRFIRGCLDLGLQVFDHADIYGDHTTEKDFGKVLLQDPGLR
ncbi:MAG: oxidoreductase, partial [Flavobacteriales bacterium]|nr:oxidoreductase [Flavobacteriales bacterium]